MAITRFIHLVITLSFHLATPFHLICIKKVWWWLSLGGIVRIEIASSVFLLCRMIKVLHAGKIIIRIFLILNGLFVLQRLLCLYECIMDWVCISKHYPRIYAIVVYFVVKWLRAELVPLSNPPFRKHYMKLFLKVFLAY